MKIEHGHRVGLSITLHGGSADNFISDVMESAGGVVLQVRLIIPKRKGTKNPLMGFLDVGANRLALVKYTIMVPTMSRLLTTCYV